MMQRCLQLAAMGAGEVAPNPMVGAVLVHKDKIIGEGYHQRYGEAHAEVNCLNSVPDDKKQFIPFSTLYVSLEPCVHFGKTPPCTDLLISQKISRVVVGCQDPSSKVSGKGIAKMKANGIAVTIGIQEQECMDLNRRFFSYHQKKRPYIVLKWAQSTDSFIALPGPKGVAISNPFTNRVVHSWRSQEQAILVGSNTASIDDPQLTNRLWSGASPLRVILDRNLRLSQSLRLFNDGAGALIFNLLCSEKKDNIEWIKLDDNFDFLTQVVSHLYQRGVISVLVEGGAKIHELFINQKLWDEARVITGKIYLKDGITAPLLTGATADHDEYIAGDQITYFRRDE